MLLRLKKEHLHLFFLKFFLFFAISTPCLAQYNFYKYSVGIGAGINLPFSDARNTKYSVSNHIQADYYFTPYIQTGIETQFGRMRGSWADQSYFVNNFQSVSWNAKMQLGQFYDRYDRLTALTSLIRGLYAGIGIGFLQNNVDAYMFDPVNGQGPKISGINRDVIFPIRGGLNLYFRDSQGRDRWELNFNSQYTFMMEDKLENDLYPGTNDDDFYFYFSSGIRYKFGTVGLDMRKQRVR